MKEGRAAEFHSTGIDSTRRKQTKANLQKSEESLRSAARRKDEFLATLAHELRNPLAPIRIATSILRDSKDNPEQLDAMIALIERQSSQLQRLIDDLLDLSRITSGKIELRRQITDLARLVEQAVESIRLLSGQEKIQLEVQLPPQPILVNADPMRLAQVIGNLLHNTFKYTEPGGWIRVTARCEHDDAVVCIKDAGIGIAPDQLSHIFDMYTQVTASLHRAQGGLGIGLRLARLLAELHDGTIEARSAGAGQGSEFIVRLPATNPPAIFQADGHTPRDSSRDAPALRRRLLIVDDNQDSLDTLSIVLRTHGHEVQTADHGEQAIAVAESFLPEIVLLDLDMPGLSGLDVARYIHGQSWGKSMMLVAMTGWGQERDKQHAAEAGFNLHLTKPIDVEMIEQLMV